MIALRYFFPVRLPACDALPMTAHAIGLHTKITPFWRSARYTLGVRGPTSATQGVRTRRNCTAVRYCSLTRAKHGQQATLQKNGSASQAHRCCPATVPKTDDTQAEKQKQKTTSANHTACPHCCLKTRDNPLTPQKKKNSAPTNSIHNRYSATAGIQSAFDQLQHPTPPVRDIINTTIDTIGQLQWYSSTYRPS